MSLSLEWTPPPAIVVVGQTFDTSRTPGRVAAMRALGCRVTCIPTMLPGRDYESRPSLAQRLRYRLRRPADPAGANAALLDAVGEGADVLWLDAADMIRPETLGRAKSINADIRIVWYSEDDMMNPRLRTIWLERSLRLFDLWVTTKSFNMDPGELPSLGADEMMFVNNSFDDNLHRPVVVTESEKQRFGSPVSFIGTFEQQRGESMLYLAEQGVRVRVWGNGWGNWVGRHGNLRVENRPAYNDDFARIVAASTVNLCFLRKANRDLQTCRSVEIPACGGFMAHERNHEISALFRPDKEAIYFSYNQELAQICSRWLERPDQCRGIGEAARQRAFELELSHVSNVARILNAARPQGIDENP